MTSLLVEAVTAVRLALAHGPWRAPTEDALQELVHRDLAMAGVPCAREVDLGPHGRIDVAVPVVDWWSGGEAYDWARGAETIIAVEVKLEASASPVVRQLARYATSPRVAAVVLATTSARLCNGIPNELAGKPVYAAHLRRF